MLPARAQVAQQLTNEVLTPRSQQAKVLGVNKVCLCNHFILFLRCNTSYVTTYQALTLPDLSQSCIAELGMLDLQREVDGRTYYEFEFATKANTYIRHALAVVTVANGECSVISAFAE